jgi:hypothetical protein
MIVGPSEIFTGTWDETGRNNGDNGIFDGNSSQRVEFG